MDLPFGALLAAVNDDIVARALIAKNIPAITQIRASDRAEGHAEGHVEGRVETVLVILELRGLVSTLDQRTRMLRERDSVRLDRWTANVMACASIDDLLR